MKKFWPIIALVCIWFIFTWPFWLKGLVPAPLDFLVGFFAPWQGSYNLPIKNPATPDIVNQIIPWKIFTIDQWKQGIIPLWNPYNFSGTPHAANWQSAVFYPFNLLMLFFDFITGWSLYVLLQPLLAGLFTYLYARSLKLSPQASILSSLAFMFSGFLTTWLEWGTLGHALLWLPLSLYSIEQLTQTKKMKFLYLVLISLSLSLLAGHLQTSLYVIILSSIYFLFRYQGHRKFALTSILLIIPLLLIAFQFFPSLELYFHSFRSQTLAANWFQAFRIPISGLVTFLAPDFFGSPVTRNHWSDYSYIEMMGYIGLVPFLLASLSLFIKHKSIYIKFFWWTAIISLLLSLKTPLANLLVWLNLPIFSSSSPARIMSLISFSLAILSGFGLDYLPKLNRQILKKFLLIIAAIFGILWIVTLIFHLSVSQRNLILPTILFTVFASVIFFMRNPK